MIFFTYSLGVLIGAATAFAADTGGVLGAGGQLASIAGAKGAATNRNVSDQLYSRSISYEKQAWSTFPPNVNLLVKSFTLGRDAAAAESQSKDLARAGLSGLSSASKSGDVNQLGLQLVGQDQMKEWATTSSKPAQESKALLAKYEKYGIHFDHDTMKLKTPAGDIDVTKDALAEGSQISKIANSFGYNADGIEKALKEGAAERDAIVKAVSAEVDAKYAQKEEQLKEMAGKVAESEPEGRDAASSAEERKPSAANPGATAASEGDPSKQETDDSGMPLVNNESDAVQLRLNILTQNLNRIRRQMGMADIQSADSIGSKDQDIFKMIHERYRAVELNGGFLD